MSRNISRRKALQYGCLISSAGLMSSLSGCSQIALGGDDGIVGGDGVITANKVNSAPESATMIQSDDKRIADHEQIQSAIQQATESGSGGVRVEERDIEDVQKTLSNLPKYSPEQDSDHEPGYYMNHNSTIIVLNFAIYD